MIRNFYLLCLLCCCSKSMAQTYTASSIFAHNDYVQPDPFYGAYNQQVGYIEADVFLKKNTLLVAHTPAEVTASKTLDELYLKPLEKSIKKNNGFVYADHTAKLTLMIDLKTEGESTLNALVSSLRKYPQLLACNTLQVAVSGNMPAPEQWKNYPSFIQFDGRPELVYTPEQLSRIAFISTDFHSHSSWNGKGVLIKKDFDNIKTLINNAHTKGKKIRFWAAPDFKNAWIQLINMKVDILCTDNVTALNSFLQDDPKNTFRNTTAQATYHPSNQKKFNSIPKNIILMIGDGMGLAQLYSGYTANKGNLTIFSIPTIGFSVTTSLDSYITDSAAGATAMATGSKTNNRFISVDSTGKPLESITEKLKRKGFQTAIISNGDVTDATPACFYAHQPERSMSEAIALDFLSGSNDILIGGGIKSFTNRKDGKNLLTALHDKGYTIAESFNALDTIQSKKMIVLDDNAVVSKAKGRDDFLSRSLLKSIHTFTPTATPFFIMLEGAQIDWGGHANDMEYIVREVLDFDQAVAAAMKFVDNDNETLLIITADHETGGLSLIDGNISEGYVKGSFSTTDHTSILVPVFSYGPSAELFKGVYQNTELNSKILSLLNK